MGLYDYNARFYDPNVARFISADTLIPNPTNPQSFNHYSYTYNNPLRYVDPTGHLTEDEMAFYFGYSGSMDTIRNSMIEVGWQDFLVNWLLESETHFGDVFTYGDGNGNFYEAMLVLFEAQESGSNVYVGGFYGLNGAGEGEQVFDSDIFSLDEHTEKANSLEDFYRENYDALPRKTGTDGYNYYDPTMYMNIATVGNLGTGIAIVGVGATAVVGVGCAAGGPAAWLACMGGSAGMVSLGATAVGAILSFTGADAVEYPLLLQPILIGNAPRSFGFGIPNGFFE